MRPNKGGNRRRIKLTKHEAKQLKGLSDLTGISQSGLMRSWTETFVSTPDPGFEPEMHTSIEMVAPAELIQQAEDKARAMYGVSLREIIRHEIAQIDEL